MKRPARYWLTYLWTGPWDVLMWLVVLGVRLLWGKKLQWVEGVWCELREDSWPARTWFKKWGAITLGHGGFGRSGRLGEMGIIDTGIEAHEHVHVEQYESAMLAGFLIAALSVGLSLILGVDVLWYWYLAVWLLMGSLNYYSSAAQAWLRGEDAYRGSHLEEAARAIAEDYYKKKNGLD